MPSKLYMRTSTVVLLLGCLILLQQLSPVLAAESEGCSMEEETDENKSAALRLKIGAIFSILIASLIGVIIPIFGKSYPILEPGSNLFFILKAFAGGVVLAVGFIHILPESFERLGSPCLPEKPWHLFPFAGFVAMLSATGTLMIDSFASGYFKRVYAADKGVADGEEVKRSTDMEGGGLDTNYNLVHTHSTHGGHAHAQELIRYRVISHVLELGIVVHSVIIGVALGTSESPSTIRPLIAALSFHQLFEGIGLGGCIVQARFGLKSIATMSLFFAVTTPVGIMIGTVIASVYNENSRTALIVEGILDSCSAGILIYMALVDLLAADFMSEKVQNSGKLQIAVNFSLLLGAGAMSIIAKWA